MTLTIARPPMLHRLGESIGVGFTVAFVEREGEMQIEAADHQSLPSFTSLR